MRSKLDRWFFIHSEYKRWEWKTMAAIDSRFLDISNNSIIPIYTLRYVNALFDTKLLCAFEKCQKELLKFMRKLKTPKSCKINCALGKGAIICSVNVS